MSTGALIFAHNNDGVDYINLANFAASRITKFLNIPVTLVTDEAQDMDVYPNNNFQSIIKIPSESATSNIKLFHDGILFKTGLKWKNLTRNHVYNLTPYDKTLVIDSDYIINSDVLKPALSRSAEFQIYKECLDLAEWRSTDYFKRVNDQSIPFYWATAFIFEKTPATEALFELIGYIKANWNYFRVLYCIKSPLFRNDFAFSIAIHIMNGKTNGNFATELPGKMTYSLDVDVLHAINDTDMQILLQKKEYKGEYIMTKTSGLDVHVMNKYSLARVIGELND